jgi:hypothetical protein
VEERKPSGAPRQYFGIFSPFGFVSVLLGSGGRIIRVLLPGEGDNVMRDFPRAVRARFSDIGEIYGRFERFFRGEPVSFPLDWG